MPLNTQKRNLMSYRLYDCGGKEITQHDLQDKGDWCQTELSIEQAFVSKFGAQLHVAMNPKKQTDPYAPDLVEMPAQTLADLKTQKHTFLPSQRKV